MAARAIRKHYLLIHFLFLVFPMICLGAIKESGAPLVGAFGFSFQKPVKHQDYFRSKKNAIVEGLNEVLGVAIVDPPEKSRFFSTYYVMVTPLYKKIHSIHGIQNKLTVSQCKENASKVYRILKEKYAYRSEGKPKYRPLWIEDYMLKAYDKEFFIFNKFMEMKNGTIVVSCDVVLSSTDCPSLLHPYKKYDLEKLKMQVIKGDNEYSQYRLTDFDDSRRSIIIPTKIIGVLDDSLFPAPTYPSQKFSSCYAPTKGYFLRISYENRNAKISLKNEIETLKQKRLLKDADAKGL